MKQYRKIKDQNNQGKCPIHNYAIPKNQNQNQKNNRINNIVPPSYTQQQSQINSSQRKSTQEKSNDINIRYNNNNINSNQNKNIPNNYYNYDNSSYIEVNYNNQSKKNMNKDSNSNINSDDYTNNYSFYISGTSRPKVILNFPERNDDNNQSITPSKYVYQTLNIPRGRNSQNQKYINSNSNENSYNNRIINQNNSSPFFIRTEDEEALIYNASRNRQPTLQRKMVNEEYNEINRVYYTNEPRDDLRNINISHSQNYFGNNDQHQPRPTIKQINNYNSNANSRRYYNANQNQNRHNIYPTTDYYDSYQQRSFNTPYIQRSYTNNSSQDYSRQRGRIIETNYSQNERTNISYHDQNPNKIFHNQNGYPINKTETNSPRYRAPYLDYSSDFSNEGNNLYKNSNWERRSEYYSNKGLRNQRGFRYKYENEINDNIYKVPELYNQGNRDIDYYEDNLGSFLSERPFTQTNTYIERDEKGRKYRVYTQDLPMNINYNSNNNTYEYGDEYNNQNNRRMNRNPPRSYKNSIQQTDYRDQEQRYKFKDRYNNIRNHNAHKSKSKKKHKKYINKGVIQKENLINRNATQPRYQRGRNSYYNHEETINMRNINKYNDNDEKEQIYAPGQLARDKDYNFRRMSNDYMMKKRQKIENNNEYPQEEEIEENDELYKKIETEISEKYYDNEGNYLGEKKTITMKKVPIDGYPQQNDEEIYEEQEEQEENENKNGKKYISYKSTHKKVTNTAAPKILDYSLNKNNYKGSKYLSYFHNTNTNNKVYHEIIGSPDNEESAKKERIKNKNHKKFIIYGIKSNNLNMLFEELQNAQKEEDEDVITYSDEKEADEQQIEIKSQIEEEEEEKGIINEKETYNNEIEKNVIQNNNENVNENANENNNENIEDNNINEKHNNNNFTLEKDEQKNNVIEGNNINISEENKINNNEDKNNDNNNQNEENKINNNSNIKEDKDNIAEQNDINKDNEQKDEENNKQIEKENINDENNKEIGNENINDENNKEIGNENINDENNKDQQNKNTVEEQNYNIEKNQNESNEEEKNQYNEGEEYYNDEEVKNQNNEEENIIFNDGEEQMEFNEEHIQNNEDEQFNQMGEEEQIDNNEEEHELNFENEDNNIIDDNIDMNLNNDENMDMNNIYEKEVIKEDENGNNAEEQFEEYEIEDNENQNIQKDEEEGEEMNADEALFQMGEEINNYQQEFEENENIGGQEGEEMDLGEEYNNIEENNIEENNENEVQN